MKFRVFYVAVLVTRIGAFSSLSKPDAASAVPIVDVTLEIVNGTHIEALVTNKGPSKLKLLKHGTLLSEPPTTENIQVCHANNGEKVEFNGARAAIGTTDLAESAFLNLPVNGRVTVPLDIATTYNLPEGSFEIVSTGFLPYAEKDSTSNVIIGTIPYTSNTVVATVNRTQTTRLRHGTQNPTKRQNRKYPHCSHEQTVLVDQAMKLCRDIADEAAYTVVIRPDLMKRFFKDHLLEERTGGKITSNQVAATVIRVLNDVSKECSKLGTGHVRIMCDNPEAPSCQPRSIAHYVTGSNRDIVLCDVFFQQTSPFTNLCYEQDRPGIIIHEMTHIPSIKGTVDYSNTYTMSHVKDLPPEQNLDDSNTYQYFAQAAYLEHKNYLLYCSDPKNIFQPPDGRLQAHP